MFVSERASCVPLSLCFFSRPAGLGSGRRRGAGGGFGSQREAEEVDCGPDQPSETGGLYDPFMTLEGKNNAGKNMTTIDTTGTGHLLYILTKRAVRKGRLRFTQIKKKFGSRYL